MSIKVKNNASYKIEVAINHWGKDGDTRFFDIEAGKNETWNRSDKRGFVMVVRKIGAQLPYYVQYDSDIIVSDDKVTDGGSTIERIA